VRRTLADYEDVKDIIAMLCFEDLSLEDRRTVYPARCLERFLMQPFAVTEQFTGRVGKLVPLQDTLEGCERILHDEFADRPRAHPVYDQVDRRSGEEGTWCDAFWSRKLTAADQPQVPRLRRKAEGDGFHDEVGTEEARKLQARREQNRDLRLWLGITTEILGMVPGCEALADQRSRGRS